MKYRFLLFISIVLLISCKHEVVKEYDVKIGTNLIHRKCIYADKKDKLSYIQIDYYPPGELLSKTTYISGKANGEYIQFAQSGRMMIHGNLSNDRINGVYQKFDSLGRLASETYYINGTKVLYSDIGETKDGKQQRQMFYVIVNDTAFTIGVLTKHGDTMIEDLSRYAIIEGDDTINTLDYCLKLKIFKNQTPETRYEIAFGEPNVKLGFSKIDTTYFSSSLESTLCGLKMKPGINHVFGRILVHEDNTNIVSDSYYVYKDVYLQKK